MKKITIIEDDTDIRNMIAKFLTNQKYEVCSAPNGRDGIELCQKMLPDLIILDLMLPVLSGDHVLRQLRSFTNIPVIVVSAKTMVQSKIDLLRMGADDYMTKPFAIEELLARIRLVLKKRGGAPSADKNQLGIGKLCMDVQRYEVSYDGQQVELTHREFELLRVLLENKNIVISRDTLLEKVCGYDYMGETNIIDVYVRYLRSKIDDVYQVKIIQTVRGVGYCIKDE